MRTAGGDLFHSNLQSDNEFVPPAAYLTRVMQSGVQRHKQITARVRANTPTPGSQAAATRLDRSGVSLTPCLPGHGLCAVQAKAVSRNTSVFRAGGVIGWVGMLRYHIIVERGARGGWGWRECELGGRALRRNVRPPSTAGPPCGCATLRGRTHAGVG